MSKLRIYQYKRQFPKQFTGKLHVVSSTKFLCGAQFWSGVDVDDPNKINFSKGICKNCSKIYNKDLNFEVIKLKLGIRK